VAGAAAAAAAGGGDLRGALLDAPDRAARLKAAGITAGQIEAALDPAGYLGSAAAFTDEALAAHRSLYA
jgi:3-carboxy-cis,cis-muconate cycloisomerase